MQHSHLEFFNNSVSKNIQGNSSGRGITLGGTELIPSLQFNSRNNNNGQIESKEGERVNVDHRTTLEKQIDIVEYLKKLPSDSKASFIDITRELQINLAEDILLLEKLKNHEYIIHTKSSDGTLFFSYRSKYMIRNKNELLITISRVRTGVPVSDIKDCYENIESDINSMMVGGEFIAVYNKDKKTNILFPRGAPFLSQLSGSVIATHGKQSIITSDKLVDEIRRGEAIKVGEYWYRVSCAVGTGTTQKSSAPVSVTSDKDPSADNVYCLPYTATMLPLDGDFDIGDSSAPSTSLNQSRPEYRGSIYKHGCTNDIKDLWKKTSEMVKSLVNDEHNLHQELIKLGLIRNQIFHSSSSSKKRKNDDETREKKKRHRLRDFEIHSHNRVGENSHLKGTKMESILRDVRKQYNDQLRK